MTVLVMPIERKGGYRHDRRVRHIDDRLLKAEVNEVTSAKRMIHMKVLRMMMSMPGASLQAAMQKLWREKLTQIVNSDPQYKIKLRSKKKPKTRCELGLWVYERN